MNNTDARLRKKHRETEPYMLLIPTMLIVLLLIVFPVIRLFSLSTMQYQLNKPNKTGFIGLENFRSLLHDEKFFISLRVSVTYSLLVVALQFLLGMIMALAMRSMTRLKGLYRAVVFAPWAVSGVLTSIIWSMMFNGSYGAINDLAIRLGILDNTIPWGTTRQTAFVMVIVASVWRGIPFFTISILAAMTSIPNELYESAKIDGANSAQLLFNITFPYIREIVVMTTLLRLIWTFNDVDIVYSMTAGGPNNATLTLPVYITRTAVEHFNFGYGSALTIGLFIILLIFSLLYMQLGKSTGDFSA
ncbi:MAG: sugar ABC transporter permease [Lachnospiraceae bacterium]|nr:sugar ABC transporter permease [Lachnospiraceae bacterium]